MSNKWRVKWVDPSHGETLSGTMSKREADDLVENIKLIEDLHRRTPVAFEEEDRG